MLELESCKIKDIGVTQSNDIEILAKGDTYAELQLLRFQSNEQIESLVELGQLKLENEYIRKFG